MTPQDVKDKIEKEYPFPERTYYRGAGFSGWPETERMRKVREGAEFGYSLAQQEIAEAKKEIQRLKSLFLDLIDVAHRQAACKNCIEELNKFK